MAQAPSFVLCCWFVYIYIYTYIYIMIPDYYRETDSPRAFVVARKGAGKGTRGFMWGGDESEASWRARLDRAMLQMEAISSRAYELALGFIRARQLVLDARAESGGPRVLVNGVSRVDQCYNLEASASYHRLSHIRMYEVVRGLMESDDGVLSHAFGFWREPTQWSRGAWDVPNQETCTALAEGWAFAATNEEDVQLFGRLVALCAFWEELGVIEDDL